MKRIGFIGASGLMGHGMAKNLRAKGYPLALTVHRNRDRVADLLAAGATLAATPAEELAAIVQLQEWQAAYPGDWITQAAALAAGV